MTDLIAKFVSIIFQKFPISRIVFFFGFESEYCEEPLVHLVIFSHSGLGFCAAALIQ